MAETVELHHVANGPAGAPFVLLGGSIGTDWQMWRAQLDDLGRRYRVVAFDTRGHGRSPAGADSPSLDDLAADVLALADRLGAGTFGYCGLSIGGAIGQVLAAQHPDRVDALVLCCTATRFGEPAHWRDRAARVRRDGMDWLVEVSRERWFAPGFAAREPALAEPMLAVLRATDPAGYAGCCEALATFDGCAALGDVTAPTLVVAGADDAALPLARAEALAAGIAGAELRVLADTGHLAPVERPVETNALIRAHLDRHLR